MWISFLQILLLLYLNLLQTRSSDPTLRFGRRRLFVPPLPTFRRLALAFFSMSFTAMAMATTGIPVRDELWRWAMLLLMAVPLLSAATVLTGYASPAACVIFVLLQLLWRLSHWPVTLIVRDPVASTFVRTLLLPPLELFAMLRLLNRLRNSGSVKRLQRWVARHQCWEAHVWVRTASLVFSSDSLWWQGEGNADDLGDVLQPRGDVVAVDPVEALRRWPMEISIGAAVAAVPGAALGSGVCAAAGAAFAIFTNPRTLPYWVVGGAWAGAIVGVFLGLALGLHMGRFAAREEMRSRLTQHRREPSYADVLEL